MISNELILYNESGDEKLEFSIPTFEAYLEDTLSVLRNICSITIPTIQEVIDHIESYIYDIQDEEIDDLMDDSFCEKCSYYEKDENSYGDYWCNICANRHDYSKCLARVVIEDEWVKGCEEELLNEDFMTRYFLQKKIPFEVEDMIIGDPQQSLWKYLKPVGVP
jgi:hypothetical protein